MTLEWISLAQLLRDVDLLDRRLPAHVSAIAGVPRSGLMVASILATRRSVPLLVADKHHGLQPVAAGSRLSFQAPKPVGPIVIVEDSIDSGRSLLAARDAAIRSGRCPIDILTAAVYGNPDCESRPDSLARFLAKPHLFEWHFFGSLYVRSCAFDMDGILCQDYPGSQFDEGPEYERWLDTVKPRWPVRPHPVPLIVTARLEKYRPQTERYLANVLGMRWERLLMGPWPNTAARAAVYDAGSFKGKHFKESRARWFVESCPLQAAAIATTSGKPVICPPVGKVYQ